MIALGTGDDCAFSFGFVHTRVAAMAIVQFQVRKWESDPICTTKPNGALIQKGIKL
jgi:hypothetical protein